ncbi:flagellar hook-associated protein 3 [Pseudomethylobacillus aquaticus]|uniref:Flagellar hook-associated protein 3 n=1 Tax=Pseudomethylobacillus aquaticus TaxID=2676064 RepID=A0A3N0V0A2_9PROT|nr:flagellar hook-associated protein FlgL [Pseudomethylobacillus aquaticus]ROH86133.1 flagellar hook-associated protein 3 [Pseudomethylobacillus aquaticus]
MRISTNTLYQAGISRISELQSQQARLQQQIASNKRLLTPSDDPVAAARALEIKQAQSLNAQYADNRQHATTQMSQVESTLGSITDLLVATKSNLVGAANPTLDNQQRGYLATELRGALDQLIGLANSRDGAGNYLFSGYQSATPAFVASPGGATYQGDNGQQLVQVASARTMPVSENGGSLFQVGTRNVFATLNDLASLLETPITTQADKDALNAGLATLTGELGTTLDQVLTKRAQVGTYLNELEQLDEAGKSRELQYAESLSDLQDLDYAKALSDLSQQQTILEAAQKSFVQTTSLSLFDLL